MQVEVKLYGILRKYRPQEIVGAPHHPFVLDITAGSTVAQLSHTLSIAEEYINATAVNGETITATDIILQEGDKVSLFPPSAGGTEPSLRVFFSGIMQAVREDDQIEDQHYRIRLRQAFQSCLPDVQITDPWAENPDSVNYEDELARQTFLSLVRRASDVDLLVAYIPVASMGSAMEMWQAYNNGVYVITISPMQYHWAIRYASHELFTELDSFLALLANGRFQTEYLPKILAHTRQS